MKFINKITKYLLPTHDDLLIQANEMLPFGTLSNNDFKNDKETHYVWKYKNNFIGSLIFETNDKDITLKYMTIYPKYRNKGLGSELLKIFDFIVKELNFPQAKLYCNSKYSFTGSFYFNRGFKYTTKTETNIKNKYGTIEEFLKDSSRKNYHMIKYY